MSLTDKEKKEAVQYALNGATFMFIPSTKLCNMVLKGSPQTTGINKVLQYSLLQKKPLRLESNMILDYCNGFLDGKNSWVLDQGDIKVVPPQFEIKTKEKEDDTGK
jgi:hypothetical protein